MGDGPTGVGYFLRNFNRSFLFNSLYELEYFITMAICNK